MKQTLKQLQFLFQAKAGTASLFINKLTRIFMKRFITATAAAFICLTLPSQETIDILQLSVRYGLPGAYKDAGYSGKATEWSSVNSFTAGAKLGDRMMWVINLNHFYFNVQGEPVPAFSDTIAHPVKVNGIILRTGLRFLFSDGRNLQLLVMPRLMSDFQNLDGSSFMFGGVATYGKRFSDRLSLGFGAMYNTELFGPYLVPIIDLNWQFAARWRFTGMIPITGRLEVSAGENLMAGLNFFGLTTSYALGAETYSGDYIEKFAVELSLFARQRIVGNLFVEGMVGRTLGRSYKQYAGDQKVTFAIPLVTFGDDRELKNEIAGFRDGLLFTLKLVYSMPLPG